MSERSVDQDDRDLDTLMDDLNMDSEEEASVEDHVHVTHDMQSRESEEREREWKPAPMIPNPHKRDDVDHRYVRIAYRDRLDRRNLSQAYREGWAPVLAADYPELAAGIMIDPDSRFPENVEFDGLLLCARPKSIGEAFMRLSEKEIEEQMDAVDRNFLRESHPHMPKLKPFRQTRYGAFGD